MVYSYKYSACFSLPRADYSSREQQQQQQQIFLENGEALFFLSGNLKTES
jgi:hypothetical protein